MPTVVEPKHLANHDTRGRGSALRSEGYQKRIYNRAIKELTTLKTNTMRKIYPALTSSIRLRKLPDIKGNKQKNRKMDRMAEDLKNLCIHYIEDLHRSSFSKGLQSSDYKLQMDAADKRWVDEFLQSEMGYFSKFFEDVREGKLTAPQVDHRLRMYMAAADSTFDSGRVVGTTPSTLVYWVMNPVKEHCKVCTFLERNSPYAVDTLPVVPRSGACFGFSNCGCILKFVRVDPLVLRVARMRMKSKLQLLSIVSRMRKRA